MAQFIKAVGLCVLLLAQCALAFAEPIHRQLTIGYLAHDEPLSAYLPNRRPHGYLVNVLQQALAPEFSIRWRAFQSRRLGVRALDEHLIQFFLVPTSQHSTDLYRFSQKVYQERWLLASLYPLHVHENVSDLSQYRLAIYAGITYAPPSWSENGQELLHVYSLKQGLGSLQQGRVDGVLLPAHMKTTFSQLAPTMHFYAMPQFIEYALMAANDGIENPILSQINKLLDSSTSLAPPLLQKRLSFEPFDLWQLLVGVFALLLLGLLLMLRQSRLKNQILSSQVRHFANIDKVAGLGLASRQELYLCIQRFMEKEQAFGVFLFEFSRQHDVTESYGINLGLKTRRAFASRSRKLLLREYPQAQLFHWRDHYFVLVMAEGSIRDSYNAVAQKIATLCRGWLCLDNLRIRTRCHVGWVSWLAEQQRVVDIEQILTQAYSAFNRAVSIQQRVCQYQPEQHLVVKARLTMEAKLRYAIDNEQLVLYFQPQFSLINQQLVGAEVLVRWRDSNGQIISPGAFIPVAEQTGLIVRLDHWVYERSMETLANWLPYLPKDFRLSVNFSAVSVSRGVCETLVSQLTQKWGIDPHWICLEITESSVMNYPDQARASFERLRQRGFDIAIDDFGTGYSSMTYLKQLPVTHLKIDQAFTAGLEKGKTDQQIVQAIATIGRSFGHKILIEGVEVLEQAQIAKRLGCEFVQGYHYAKPMRGSDFITKYLSVDPTKLALLSA
ncbi:putative bifunctional diguanylate cyclase/phosphodiesterase [Celerinatantimonas sp. YJH-8]|uniref:putative bifunctional diguanylate cyclase/phosphodiesterase n=1 Tax=Celerinatantimonas sp. YJH-8 TaxID=3228714 RepID=UPI0038C9F9A8